MINDPVGEGMREILRLLERMPPFINISGPSVELFDKTSTTSQCFPNPVGERDFRESVDDVFVEWPSVQVPFDML